MNNKMLIEMIEAVAYEKAMPMETVRMAMEGAIAALVKRENRATGGFFKASIDEDGNVQASRVWEVVEQVEDEDREIALADAPEGAEIGDTVEEEVSSPKWTRQGLQVVKQVLFQRLKQGLRQTIAENWQNRVGEVVIGSVKRIVGNKIILDLGEPVEGIIAGNDRIPRERLKVGNRVRAYVSNVAGDGNGPVITLSRSSEEFLRELIKIEVPEVEIGQVIINAIAREAGGRSKVAVSAGHGLKASPTAICIGMRGVRANAIQNEFGGERVEFVEWNEDPAQFLVNALSPAEIKSLVIDEDKNKVFVGVNKENLSRAIGARGQNIRLASKLTGWNIELMSVEELEKKRLDDDQKARQFLMDSLEIDDEFAEVLVDEGYTSLESIAYSPIGDLLFIEGITEDLVDMLKDRAMQVLEFNALVDANQERENSIAGLDGVSDEDVALLKEQEIESLQDLADLGIGDIDWPEERDDELSSWIMQARKKVGMI